MNQRFTAQRTGGATRVAVAADDADNGTGAAQRFHQEAESRMSNDDEYYYGSSSLSSSSYASSSTVDFGNVNLYLSGLQFVFSICMSCLVSLLCCYIFLSGTVSAVRTITLTAATAALFMIRPLIVKKTKYGIETIFKALQTGIPVYLLALVVEQLVHTCSSSDEEIPSYRYVVFHSLVGVAILGGFLRAHDPLSSSDASFFVSSAAFVTIALIPPPSLAMHGPLCSPTTGWGAAERLTRCFVYASLYAIHVYSSTASHRSRRHEWMLVAMRSASAVAWTLASDVRLLPIAVVQAAIAILRRIATDHKFAASAQYDFDDVPYDKLINNASNSNSNSSSNSNNSSSHPQHNHYQDHQQDNHQDQQPHHQHRQPHHQHHHHNNNMNSSAASASGDEETALLNRQPDAHPSSALLLAEATIPKCTDIYNSGDGGGAHHHKHHAGGCCAYNTTNASQCTNAQQASSELNFDPSTNPDPNQHTLSDAQSDFEQQRFQAVGQHQNSFKPRGFRPLAKPVASSSSLNESSLLSAQPPLSQQQPTTTMTTPTTTATDGGFDQKPQQPSAKSFEQLARFYAEME